MNRQSGKNWQRSYWYLFATQFQESFSDNAYKFLLTSFVIAMGLSKDQRDTYVSVILVLFSLPFILFSMSGGYLADRFSKRSVIIGLKFAEILIMCIALAGLALRNFPIMIAALILRSTQSACFSPSKFGLLPELLPDDELSWGNGVFELGIFLAIILGTVGGSTMHDTFEGKLWWAGVILIGLAFFGLATGSGIQRVPAANPAKKFRLNFFKELFFSNSGYQAGSHALPGCSGKHLFLFRCRIASSHHPGLRVGRSQNLGGTRKLPSGFPCNWYRIGQLPGGVFFQP